MPSTAAASAELSAGRRSAGAAEVERGVRHEFVMATLCAARARSQHRLSTTLENEAIVTVENEATQTDWMGDLYGGLR